MDNTPNTYRAPTPHTPHPKPNTIMVSTMSHTMQAEAQTMEEVEAMFAAMRESLGKFGISRVAMWITVDAKSPLPIDSYSEMPDAEEVFTPCTKQVFNTPEEAVRTPKIVPPNKHALSLSKYAYHDVTNITEDERRAALTEAMKANGHYTVLSKLSYLAMIPDYEGGARRSIYQADYQWAADKYMH